MMFIFIFQNDYFTTLMQKFAFCTSVFLYVMCLIEKKNKKKFKRYVVLYCLNKHRVKGEQRTVAFYRLFSHFHKVYCDGRQPG